MRIGTTCRSMTEEEIEKRYIDSLTITEKQIEDIEVLRDDFTFNKFKKYLLVKGILVNDDTFYKNFNLITKTSKFNILAELLADDNMNSIKVSVFEGKDKSTFIKRNEYGYTCLLESLDKILTYCESLNETFVDLSVRPRIEKRMFNAEAFKEAWINACVHNKWSEQLCPAVYWFEDRLEIVSYGGLPKNLTKEEFLEGKTEPVNKALMKIFLQCGIVEHSGHGVPIVVREYGENAYKFSQNMITVTIPFYKPNYESDDQNENNSRKNIPDKLTKSSIRVLELVKINPKITQEEITLQTNLSLSTIKRALKTLTDNGIIKRIGSNRNGYWEIIK